MCEEFYVEVEAVDVCQYLNTCDKPTWRSRQGLVRRTRVATGPSSGGGTTVRTCCHSRCPPRYRSPLPHSPRSTLPSHRTLRIIDTTLYPLANSFSTRTNREEGITRDDLISSTMISWQKQWTTCSRGDTSSVLCYRISGFKRKVVIYLRVCIHNSFLYTHTNYKRGSYDTSNSVASFKNKNVNLIDEFSYN